jgi:hypothetical protein
MRLVADNEQERQPWHIANGSFWREAPLAGMSALGGKADFPVALPDFWVCPIAEINV